MAKRKERLLVLAQTTKETANQRAARIEASANGATLRTRVIKDKSKYQRNIKHKTSFASAEDVFLCKKLRSTSGVSNFLKAELLFL